MSNRCRLDSSRQARLVTLSQATRRSNARLHLPVTRSASETQVAIRHSTGSHHPAARTQTATATKTAPPTPNAVLHHRVKRGETLTSIATSYNTTVSALKHDNRNIAALRPG